MAGEDFGGDDSATGNEPWDQAEQDFLTKGGYDYGFWANDEYAEQDRARAYRRVFKTLLTVASPQGRVVLEAALAQINAGQALNWEAIARELGKSSGAVKTQVRRAAEKLRKKK
jgi:DNA-directed RNA polymerase specialized sigma24 family protein